MMCDLDEGVAHIGHGSSGAEAEGDLDDRHGEAVARLCIMHIVWGCKVRACVDQPVVDKRGICGNVIPSEQWCTCFEEHFWNLWAVSIAIFCLFSPLTIHQNIRI